MTDPTPPPPSDDVAGEELEVGLHAFLPDGVSLSPDDEQADEADVDDLPEPEVPAWALDDPGSDDRASDDRASNSAASDESDLDDEPEGDIDDDAPDDPVLGEHEAEADHEVEADEPDSAVGVEGSDHDEVPDEGDGDGSEDAGARADVEQVAVEGVVVIDDPADEPEVTPGGDAVEAEASEVGVPEDDADATQVEAEEPDYDAVGAPADDLDEVDDGPALPAWALPEILEPETDEEPVAVEPVGVARDDQTGDGPDGPYDVEPPAAASAEDDTVDTSVLERLEAELAEVEDALAAIDAGDLDRSPLLVRLLADLP